MSGKFVDITESKDINIRALIQTLKDIRQLHDTFPELSIKVKQNYDNIVFTNEIGIYSKKATMEVDAQGGNGSGTWKIKAHNLPTKATKNCLRIGSVCGLKSAVENFLLVCNNLIDFFKAMDSIDSVCQILEPVEGPKRDAAAWRLLKYSKFVSIKVEFLDPLDIRNIVIKFYGKERLVDKLEELIGLNGERQESDEEDVDASDFYRHLCSSRLNILDFPAVENKEEEKEHADCAICLCHESDCGELPFICCESLNCDCQFHPRCLTKHVNIKSNTRILTTVLGECPFCKQRIAPSFINLLQNCNLLDEEN